MLPLSDTVVGVIQCCFKKETFKWCEIKQTKKLAKLLINEVVPPCPFPEHSKLPQLNPPHLVPVLLTWIQNTKGKQFQDFHLFCVTIISTSSFKLKLLRKSGTLLKKGWGLGSQGLAKMDSFCSLKKYTNLLVCETMK